MEPSVSHHLAPDKTSTAGWSQCPVEEKCVKKYVKK